MADTPAKARLPDEAVLALVQVVFGSLAIAGKVAIPQVGSLTLAAVRVGCAAIILVLLERWLVGHRIARKDWPVIAVLSMLGVAFNQLLFLIGLGMTTAVEATVIITTIPVFTLAVGLAWKREVWSTRKGLGMAIAFAGVVLLVGASALEFGSRTFLGDLLIALNALCYSVYLVASRPVLKRIPPLTLTAGAFAVAAVVMLPMGLLGLGAVQAGGPDGLGGAAIAYIILGPTVFTYFAVSHVLVRVPASTVASFIYIQPLVGVVLGVLLLHESLTPRILGAAALILVGVALCTLQLRRVRRMVPAA